MRIVYEPGRREGGGATLHRAWPRRVRWVMPLGNTPAELAAAKGESARPPHRPRY